MEDLRDQGNISGNPARLADKSGPIYRFMQAGNQPISRQEDNLVIQSWGPEVIDCPSRLAGQRQWEGGAMTLTVPLLVVLLHKVKLSYTNSRPRSIRSLAATL